MDDRWRKLVDCMLMYVKCWCGMEDERRIGAELEDGGQDYEGGRRTLRSNDSGNDRYCRLDAVDGIIVVAGNGGAQRKEQVEGWKLRKKIMGRSNQPLNSPQAGSMGASPFGILVAVGQQLARGVPAPPPPTKFKKELPTLQSHLHPSLIHPASL